MNPGDIMPNAEKNGNCSRVSCKQTK